MRHEKFNLLDAMERVSLDKIDKKLKTFRCPLNPEVEKKALFGVLFL